jgi:hypothetical protein
MKTVVGRILPVGAIILLQLANPVPAFATQGHGGIEGVYVHQLAHLFFIVSMAVLIYWLRTHKLVIITGWRFIQYAAFFLILWNADAMLVHALDDQFDVVQVQRIGTWRMRLTAPYPHQVVQSIYYAAKLDHLLSVPALLFLYLGIRRLLKESEASPKERASH